MKRMNTADCNVQLTIFFKMQLEYEKKKFTAARIFEIDFDTKFVLQTASNFSQVLFCKDTFFLRKTHWCRSTYHINCFISIHSHTSSAFCTQKCVCFKHFISWIFSVCPSQLTEYVHFHIVVNPLWFCNATKMGPSPHVSHDKKYSNKIPHLKISTKPSIKTELNKRAMPSASSQSYVL